MVPPRQKRLKRMNGRVIAKLPFFEGLAHLARSERDCGPPAHDVFGDRWQAFNSGRIERAYRRLVSENGSMTG